MNLAIVGATNPLAKRFVEQYAQALSDTELYFYDLREFCPLMEVGEREYPIMTLTEDSLPEHAIDFALFFGNEAYKDFILQAEDLGIQSLDLSAAFRMESTIPLTLTGLQPLQTKAKILSIPSPHLHVFGELLVKLDEQYPLRRVGITVFQSARGAADFIDVKDSDEELEIINETKRILDNNQVRITASVYNIPQAVDHYYHLSLEFARPFNMDILDEMLVEIKQNHVYRQENLDLTSGVTVMRRRRDLSVDSGLHLLLRTQDLDELVIHNLIAVISEIRAHLQNEMLEMKTTEPSQ